MELENPTKPVRKNFGRVDEERFLPDLLLFVAVIVAITFFHAFATTRALTRPVEILVDIVIVFSLVLLRYRLVPFKRSR